MTKSKLIICSGDSYTAGDELAGDLFVEGYTSTLYPNNQKMTDERKKIIEKLTASKSHFGIENTSIKEGEKANITLFNPNGNWTFEKENILSKSKNSAFIGAEMKGKVYGIYNQGKLVLS